MNILLKNILLVFGFIAGIVSAIVGVGGAIFTIPFLLHCKVHIRQIIATSSSVIFYLSMGATLGYFLISLSLPNEIKIPYSFGLIYLPALFGSLIGSLIFSKIGVKVAQKINENILTKMLGILFLFLGTFMISKTNFF